MMYPSRDHCPSYNSQHIVAGLTGKVVVYGSNADVYCCVQSLLQTGLPGKQIVIVEPPPTSSEVTCNLRIITLTLTQKFIWVILSDDWSSIYMDLSELLPVASSLEDLSHDVSRSW